LIIENKINPFCLFSISSVLDKILRQFPQDHHKIEACSRRFSA